MFDSSRLLIDGAATGSDPAASETTSPERATSFTCPHCSYVNWCTFDPGHGGSCHCDQGHYWSGNH